MRKVFVFTIFYFIRIVFIFVFSFVRFRGCIILPSRGNGIELQGSFRNRLHFGTVYYSGKDTGVVANSGMSIITFTGIVNDNLTPRRHRLTRRR